MLEEDLPCFAFLHVLLVFVVVLGNRCGRMFFYASERVCISGKALLVLSGNRPWLVPPNSIEESTFERVGLFSSSIFLFDLISMQQSGIGENWRVWLTNIF